MTGTLRELEKRLDKEPDNLSLRVTVAGLLSEAGRKADAVELYRSVAIAYRAQGRNQQAIAVCRSILELAPDDIAIHALLAELVKDHQGRPHRDTADQYAAISVEPGTPPPATATGERRARTPSGQEQTATGVRPPPASNVPVRPLVPSPAGVKTPSRPPASTRTPQTGAPAVKPSGSIPGVPVRRSSGEVDTPLPRPVPYHVADPTTSRVKQEALGDDLPVAEGAETNPGRDPAPPSQTSGLAQAARRISGLIAQDPRHDPDEVDLAAELETRQVVRVSAAELEKVSRPPPTVPVEMVEGDELHDLPTPPPPATWRRPATAPAIPIRDTPLDPPTGLDHAPARDTDDELTAPRELVAADPLANAFFVALPPNRRDVALARCTIRAARAGTIVIRQGETSHPLLLVVTGKLELRVERANGTLAMVDTIDTGQYIGEAALLGRMPAPANVIAATDCELYALPPHALFELAGAYPALWAALKDTAERRARQYERAIRGAP